MPSTAECERREAGRIRGNAKRFATKRIRKLNQHKPSRIERAAANTVALAAEVAGRAHGTDSDWPPMLLSQVWEVERRLTELRDALRAHTPKSDQDHENE